PALIALSSKIDTFLPFPRRACRFMTGGCLVLGESTMRRWIRALWQKEPTRRLPAQRPASKRPGLEVLEDRCVPSVSATGQSFLLVAGHAPTQPVQIASFSDST